MAIDLTQILPQLFVGSCPRSPEDIDFLKLEMGVTAVVNLQTSGDFSYWDIDWPSLEAHYRETGVEIRWMPVQDYNPDALRKCLPRCVDAVDGFVREGKIVYIHCNIGVNRSPSVAIAYLHWIEGQTLDEAVEFVTGCRSCKPHVDAISRATEERPRLNGGG